MDGMDFLFKPERIAVIGASRFPEKVGYEVFKNLLQSDSKVYPVNINDGEILGKTAYKSLLEIEDEIDLAVICVPAPIVPDVLKDVVKKKVKACIIISAGFSEAGEAGRKIEEKVGQIIRKSSMRLLGPNVLGIINPTLKLNASFFDGMPKQGGISFISQSGALGVAMLDWAIKNDIGLANFASVGNMLDIDFSDLIEYFGRDENTSAIICYIEALKDGREFMKACKKVSRSKRIIVLKAGRTAAGKRAALSHTASLAGDEDIYSAAFKQAGVTRVNTLKELFNTALAASKFKTIGRNICIVSNAGGPAVIASDAFERHGFNVEPLPKDIVKKLDKVLPANWSENNPIDIIGDAKSDRYKAVFDVLAAENFFDFCLCILTPQAMTQADESARVVAEFYEKTGKPVFTCFMGGNKVEDAKKILKEHGILNFDEPEEVAQMLVNLK